MQYAHEKYDRKSREPDEYRPSFPLVREDLWDRFDAYLLWRHLNPDLARDNGWYPAKYKRVPRVIIPCSNAAGIPYWQGRDMTDTDELRYASPFVARDDSLVIVWPEGKRTSKGGIIIEGPTDALCAADHGFVGVALMGNNPTTAVFDHLHTFARAFQPIFVVPDADALEFCANVISALAQRGLGAKVLAPLKKDLAEMNVRERRRFLDV